MVTNPDLIFTPGWRHVYDRFIKEAYTNARGFKEAIGFSYSFDPRMDHCMSTNTSLFELRKAAAMYFGISVLTNQTYLSSNILMNTKDALMKKITSSIQIMDITHMLLVV